MPAPTIDDLPSAPSRSNVANFNTDAETFVAGLEAFVTQAQAFIDYLNTQGIVIGDQINGTPIGLSLPAAGAFTGAVIGQGQAADIPLSLYSDDPNCYLTLNDDTTTGNGVVAVLATGDDLKLRAGGSNLVELAGGHVGINKANPEEHLHIGAAGRMKIDGALSGYALVGTAASSGGASIKASSGESASTFIDFDAPEISAAGGGISYRFGRNTTEGAAGSGSQLVLYAHDGANNPVIKMDSNGDADFAGRVGIGTTSPAHMLEARENTSGTAAKFVNGAGNSSNNHVLHVEHEWASFANDVVRVQASRAGSSAYSLLTGRSGAGADMEFRISGDGNGVCDGSWTGGGADYAEFFEWADGNPAGEDRRGLSVVLDGDKIRPALTGEQPIGVISANPSVIGDGDIDRWKEKYLRDDFGAYVWEDYEAVSWTETVAEVHVERVQKTAEQERTRALVEIVGGQAVQSVITETVKVPVFDEFPLFDDAGAPITERVQVGMSDPVLDGDGKELEPARPVYEDRQVIHREPCMIEVQHETTKEEKRSYATDALPEGVTVPPEAVRAIQQRRKLNPAYDPAQEYVPRAERPEWDTVGLMGKLRLRKGQPVGANWILMRDVSADVEEWLVR